MDELIKKLEWEELDNIKHARKRAIDEACYAGVNNKSLNKLADLGIMEIRRGWDKNNRYFVLTVLGREAYQELRERRIIKNETI